MKKIIAVKTKSLLDVPATSGVYAVSFGCITKFGKAKNLKQRLASYGLAVAQHDHSVIYAQCSSYHLAETILLAKARSRAKLSVGTEAFACAEDEAETIFNLLVGEFVDVDILNRHKDFRIPSGMALCFAQGRLNDMLYTNALEYMLSISKNKPSDVYVETLKNQNLPYDDEFLKNHIAENSNFVVVENKLSTPNILKDISNTNPHFLSNTAKVSFYKLCEYGNPIDAIWSVEAAASSINRYIVEMLVKNDPNLIEHAVRDLDLVEKEFKDGELFGFLNESGRMYLLNTELSVAIADNNELRDIAVSELAA